MIVAPASQLAQFDPGRFGIVTLLEDEHLHVLLVALEAGQEIPVHAPEADLVLTVAEGVGELLAGSELHPLHAGDVAVIPAGERRGIRAHTTRLVLVNVVSPPPTPADHARGATRWPQHDDDRADPAALVHAEHAEIRQHLDHLRTLAEDAATADEAALRQRLDHVLAFLRSGVLAHAQVEEATVYPAAERLLRALGGATDTMTLEHEQIRARVQDLEHIADERRYSEAARGRLARSLEALEALLRAHFDKEEQVYLPLLAHLAPTEARALAAALEVAAPEGHQH